MKPELFQKVYTKYRLPEEEGNYIINTKEEYFPKLWHFEPGVSNQYFINHVDWWLEELPIPSDDDIENHYLKVEPRGYGCSYYKGLVNGAKDARDNKIHIQNK
jgi:hypothetical protein